MFNQPCVNCGHSAGYDVAYPVNEALKKTWEISEETAAVFNRREGNICKHCGVNIRAQALAKAILDSSFGFDSSNLNEWVEHANAADIKVCELNACHELHGTLKRLKNLTYAEYGTPSQQNIEQLSYKDNSFDLVLHSETLEHVNNPARAMDECRRVLNSKGVVLFTIPILWNRKTRRRAKLHTGTYTYLLPASYHGKVADDYLVFYEYGADVDEILQAGVTHSDWLNQNYVFFSGKNPTTIKPSTKQRLKVLERIAAGREKTRSHG